MTTTPNLHLPQWEETDRIQMDDFNDAMASIDTAVAAAGNCKIVTGTYTGTGTYGEANRSSITFDFPPKFVWIGTAPTRSETGMLFWHEGVSNHTFANSDYDLEISVSGNTITWYNRKNANYQLNYESRSYYYIALG